MCFSSSTPSIDLAESSNENPNITPLHSVLNDSANHTPFHEKVKFNHREALEIKAFKARRACDNLLKAIRVLCYIGVGIGINVALPGKLYIVVSFISCLILIAFTFALYYHLKFYHVKAEYQEAH